jgi:hypothetical protein
MRTGITPVGTVSVIADIASAHTAGPAQSVPRAPIGVLAAADIGGLAFDVARLALAAAGLLAVLYAVGLLVLTLCAHWIRR